MADETKSSTTGITQETAGKIWEAHREIVTSEKLLEDIEKAQRSAGDRHATHLKDAFGRQRNLQLGIPQGENGHQLLDVHPDIAKTVIKAHVLEKRSQLFTLNALATRELAVLGEDSS